MITNLTPSDLIYNALLIGMTLKDACIFAGLSPSQITSLMEDEEQVRKYQQVQRQCEMGLLERLNTVIDKQTNMGKESAVTWLLERVNPERWGKVNAGEEGQSITINFDPTATSQAVVEYDDEEE